MSSPIKGKGEVSPWEPVESPKEKKPPIGFWASVGISCGSAVSVVPIYLPMSWFKGRSQEVANKKAEQAKLALEKPIKMDFHAKFRLYFQGVRPSHLYRGIGVTMANFVPTIILQSAVERAFSFYMDSLVSATLAGGMSAIVVGPGELIMNQQQKTNRDFWSTARMVHNQYGLRGYFRGIAPTAGREGIFTPAYLYFPPLLKDKFQSMGVNALLAQFLAGVISGIGAAVLSHPLDTYKTMMQRDFTMEDTFWQVLRHKKPFAGLVWRVTMVATVTTSMPAVKNWLRKRIDE